MLVLGSLFSSLPTCVLGSAIIVALFPMFEQFSQLPQLWRLSKSDFAIWVITCASTVFLDIGLGLGIGIGVVLFSAVVLSRISKGYLLQEAGAADLHVAAAKHTRSTRTKGVAIFRFEGTLYYASAQRFKSELYAATLDPREQQAGKDDSPNEEVEKDKHSDVESMPDSIVPNGKGAEGGIHTIIIDCSALTFLDMTGINTIKDLAKDFPAVGVQVVLAATSERVQSALGRAGVLGGEDSMAVYPTIEDAISVVSSPAPSKAPVKDTHL